MVEDDDAVRETFDEVILACNANQTLMILDKARGWVPPAARGGGSPIDRYLPPRDEHSSPGYAPYGLGTRICLGIRSMELQLVVNLLMIAHHFNLEVHPANFKFNPLPSMKPSKKLKFLVARQRREITV